QDFDECYPTDLKNGNNPERLYRLVMPLSPYIKNRHIFYCPSAPRGEAFDPTITDSDANWSAGNITYLHWSFLALDQKRSLFGPPRLISERSDPDVWLMTCWFQKGKAPFLHHEHTLGLPVLHADTHVGLIHGRPIDNWK
ncbi:MAG: hypothetical protein IT210_21495, partial [Armatimonadetes bacterium]|nr:hypothetical protein [Armatimonadota bacterium]